MMLNTWEGGAMLAQVRGTPEDILRAEVSVLSLVGFTRVVNRECWVWPTWRDSILWLYDGEGAL